jgi:hypothetical protein
LRGIAIGCNMIAERRALFRHLYVILTC